MNEANQNLIDGVIENMQIDIQKGDWTAIKELLRHVDDDVLYGFMSDLGIADYIGEGK